MTAALPSLTDALTKALLTGRTLRSGADPGATITHGVSFADYCAIDALNFSALRHVETSPLHYRRARDFARRDSKAMQLGRLVHALILCPEAPPDVAIYEGKVKSGKVWDAFEAEHAGAFIVRRDELAKAEAMRAAVMAYGPARELLEDGQGEVTIRWGAHGMALKGRADWLGSGGLVDLKTTRSISARAFTREAASRAMHCQVAMYAWGIESASDRRPDSWLLAVENVPPHDVVVYRVSDETIDAGLRTVDGWIRRVAECEQAGSWPGVGGAGPLDLTLPDWAMVGGDDVDLSGIGGGDE